MPPPSRESEGTLTTEHAVVALHQGVYCDSCSKLRGDRNFIMGPRYRCNSCRDFDLCSICYEGRTHPSDHYFYVIPTPLTATNK